MIDDDFIYNNEDEADMGQLQAIHLNMNAIADLRMKLAKQAKVPSATECVECGEDIPEARQKLVPGVQMCVDCQSLHERK